MSAAAAGAAVVSSADDELGAVPRHLASISISKSISEPARLSEHVSTCTPRAGEALPAMLQRAGRIGVSTAAGSGGGASSCSCAGAAACCGCCCKCRCAAGRGAAGNAATGGSYRCKHRHSPALPRSATGDGRSARWHHPARLVSVAVRRMGVCGCRRRSCSPLLRTITSPFCGLHATAFPAPWWIHVIRPDHQPPRAASLHLPSTVVVQTLAQRPVLQSRAVVVRRPQPEGLGGGILWTATAFPAPRRCRPDPLGS